MSTTNFTNVVISDSLTCDAIVCDSILTNDYITNTDISATGSVRTNSLIPITGNTLTINSSNLGLVGDTISIGNPGATGSNVTIYGNTQYINSNHLNIFDPLVTYNYGGATGASIGSGFQVVSGVTGPALASFKTYSDNGTTIAGFESSANLKCNVLRGNSSIISGSVSAGSLSVSGALQSNTLGVTGACSVGSLSVAGTASFNNLTVPTATIPTLTSTNITTGSLGVTGNCQVGSLGVTGAINSTSQINTGNITTGSLGVNGNITTGSLGVTGACSLGSLGVTGTTTLTTFTGNTGTITNLSSTTGNITTLNSNAINNTTEIKSATITVSGNTKTQTLGCTGLLTSGSITNTGNITTGSLIGTTGTITTINSTTLNSTNATITNLTAGPTTTIGYSATNYKVTAYANSTAKSSFINFFANDGTVENRNAYIECNGPGATGVQNTGELLINGGKITLGNGLSTGVTVLGSTFQVTSPAINLYGDINNVFGSNNASGSITTNNVISPVATITTMNSTTGNITTLNSTTGNITTVNSNSIVNTTGINTATLTATGLISGSTIGGTLTTASQPNITSVGTLTNLTATGNITGARHIAKSLTLDTACNGLPTGSSGAYHHIDYGARSTYLSQDATDNTLNYFGMDGGGGLDPDFMIAIKKSRGLLVYDETTAAIDAWAIGQERLRVAGTAKITGNLSCDSNLTISGTSTLPTISGTTGTITTLNSTTGNITTLNSTTGNITAVNSNSIINTTGINTATLTATGLISGSTIGGTLTTALQPNITSVGTLTNVNCSGDIIIKNGLQIGASYKDPTASPYISLVKGGNLIDCATIQASSYQFSSDRVINDTFTTASLFQIGHTTSTTVGFSATIFLDVVFSVTNTLNQTASRSYQAQMNIVKERANTICNCATNVGTASSVPSSSGATITGGPNLSFTAIAGAVALNFSQPIVTGTYAYTSYSYHGRLVVNQLSPTVSHIQNLITNIAVV